MIRFSAFLVVVAVGLLVAGVVTSKLLLVYIAIGVSGVALLALGIGVAVNWRELTGKPRTAAAETSAQGPVPRPEAARPGSAGSSPAGRPLPGGVAAEAARYGGRRDSPRRVRLARHRFVRSLPGRLPAHRAAAKSPAPLGQPVPAQPVPPPSQSPPSQSPPSQSPPSQSPPSQSRRSPQLSPLRRSPQPQPGRAVLPRRAHRAVCPSPA